NGVEVLHGVDHHEGEEHGEGGGEQAHLPHPYGVGGLDQPGVVDVAGEVELGGTRAAAELSLLRQQLGVVLGDPRVQTAAGFEIGCCACGHWLSFVEQGIGSREQGLENPNYIVHCSTTTLLPNP